jgi:tetratricopeptide (TPR) repeat protein
MVLPWGRGGRVGRRRDILEGPPGHRAALLFLGPRRLLTSCRLVSVACEYAAWTMARPLKSRPGRPGSRAPSRSTLPRDLIEDVRRTARPIHADAAIAHLERAAELLARRDPRGAAKEAERAKALAPRSSVIRETLGLAYYGQGLWREALRELQAYRRLSGRVDQNHIIADSHRGLNQPERALAPIMDVLRAPRISDEVRAEATVVGASALADLGRLDEALGLLRRFPTREQVGRPHDLRIWYVTGDVLARAGRRDEAAREFKRILRFDPAAFDAAERLAQLG